MRRAQRTTTALVVVLVLLAGACAKKASNDPVNPGTAKTSTTLVARPPGYVALGDSYTAGGGAPPYDVDPTCAVSSKGYPYALDAADDHVHLVALRACGGAKAAQMIEAWPARGLPAQIPGTPDATVGLVTFTIGGNDSALLPVLAACATVDCSGITLTDKAKDTLSALIDTLDHKVYPALRKAYPKARLVHVGYPLLTSTKLNQTCPWLASDEETVPNQLVAAVNTTLAAAARRSGDVEYLDVSRAFTGHEICTDHPWANDITAGINALHPTAEGYVALGQAIAAALQR